MADRLSEPTYVSPMAAYLGWSSTPETEYGLIKQERSASRERWVPQRTAWDRTVAAWKRLSEDTKAELVHQWWLKREINRLELQREMKCRKIKAST